MLNWQDLMNRRRLRPGQLANAGHLLRFLRTRVSVLVEPHRPLCLAVEDLRLQSPTASFRSMPEGRSSIVRRPEPMPKNPALDQIVPNIFPQVNGFLE